MKASLGKTVAPGLAALIVLAGGAAEAPGKAAAATAGPQSSRGEFLSKCSRCHGSERAYGAMSDPANWARTVASMALKDRSWIPPDSLREILSYRRNILPHQKTIFGRCCGSCHDWEGIRALDKSPSRWRTCITYMAKKECGEVTPEETELLLLGLRGDLQEPRAR